MIFASLGTMNIAFNRMAKAVDEWAAITKEEVNWVYRLSLQTCESF